MKRFISLSLAALTLMFTLAGCQSEPTVEALTPEELTTAYQTSIDGARDEESVTYVPVMSSFDDELAEFILPMFSITADNTTAFAVAVSPMNTRAYAVAAIMPAEGQEEAVLEGVNAYVSMQQTNFEMYLVDQYEIAQAAVVETLDDGTILLVMCEGAAGIAESIKTALAG